MIYSFTGQPGSGKTTLAQLLKTVLETNNPEKKAFVIDGDILRKVLANKDYSEKGRRRNIEQAYGIARYIDNDPQHDVIIALVSPFRDLREKLKLTSDVIEIYVHTKDIRGKEDFHVEEYEQPFIDYIDIDTTDVDQMTSMNMLLDQIQAEFRNRRQ